MRARSLVVVWVTLAIGCSNDGLSTGDAIGALPEALQAKVPRAVLHALLAGEPQEVVLVLNPAAQESSGDTLTTAAVATRPLVAWGDTKRELLSIAPALRATHAWDELPLLRVRAEAYDPLVTALSDPRVIAASLDEQLTHFDAESFPLMRQPDAAAGGKTGAGVTVAVLDTGADYTRADLGSCTAPGVPATCKVAFARDFATEDNQRDDNGHGTNVSGIVLGVAPGARVLALDVFDGGSASSTVIIDAINWVIANRATYKIAAINLSLGGGSSTVPCTTNAMGTAIASARAAGILTAVASGNDGFLNALSAPACAPSAISVGAVYDAPLGRITYSTCADANATTDGITCFSNSASFLSVLAPGALITAAGYTMAGTSQAAPHIAGAIAVLRAALPNDTADALAMRLTTTGRAITDPRNGLVARRVDLVAALGGTPAPAADTTPPVGSVVINAGAATTRTAQVTLTITGTDPSGVTQMCVTNTTTCTAFEAFAATRAWTLAAGDGTKSVAVWLRDSKGNTTTATTSPVDSIAVDATAPTDGLASAKPANLSVALAWSGFADATSGLATYRVVGVAGTTAPAAGCAGTALYTGTALTTTQSGLVNGSTYSYRVCAVDVAGNVSAGAVVSAMPRPESNAPVGSVLVENGAVFARSTTVALALKATDDSGVAQMCISTTANTCTTWVAFAATATITVPTGLSYVYARFRDKWGNESAPVSDGIIVDMTPPTQAANSVTATPGVKQIALAWAAPTDTTSGIARCVVTAASGTTAPPASCASGTVLFSGSDLKYTHVVATGETWSYRVCAVDGAGNVTAGVTVTATGK